MLVFRRMAIVLFIFATACQHVNQKPELALSLDSATEVVEKKPLILTERTNFSANDAYIFALFLTGEIAIQRKQLEIALEAYLQIAELTQDAMVAEKATRLGVYLNDPETTAQAASIWLRQDPNNMIAREIGLSVALNLYDSEALVVNLSAVLHENPALFETILFEMQKKLKNTDDVEFIYAGLDSLAKLYPQQAIIFLSQSLLAARLNKIDLAREKISMAIKLQPQWEKALELETELLLYSGKLAYKEKKFTEALAWFDKISLEKHRFSAETAAITTLEAQKKFPEAAARLQNLLTEYPEKKHEVLIMQAESHNNQGNYQRAFDVLSEILVQNPDDKTALYSRALTAEKLDNLIVLEADLQKILAQDPNDIGALNALGYSLADKTQRYEEAETYLKRALVLQPDEAVIIDSYGWLLFKQGNLTQSLEYLQTAYDKLAENEIVAHLAEVLWHLNQQQKAKAMVLQALKDSPEDEFLLEFKSRILDQAVGVQ